MATATNTPSAPKQSESPAFSGTSAGSDTAKKRRWLTPVLGVVAALAIGIFGGVLIGHATASSTQASTQSGFPSGMGGTGTGGAGGGFTSGTVSSVDGDTITLKTSDGSTVKVTTSDDTTVTKSDDASVSDLAKGDTVSVIGTTDSSGNVTATSVSEGTLAGGFGGGTAPSNSTNG